jgi:DnaK suppressor protein
MTTDKNLKTIKQTLEEQRANLSAFLEKKTSVKGKDLSNPEKINQANTFHNRNRETLLLDNVNGQLDDINQALIRIEKGIYGICKECGENIQFARLDIMPTAVLCIDCQGIQENS